MLVVECGEGGGEEEILVAERRYVCGADRERDELVVMNY